VTRIGISITKSVAFRNSTQEFSNVYYYDGLGGVPSVSEADGLIDTATARVKTFHAASVTFVRGRLWTETGNKATNEMVSQKNLSGTGARTASILDKERAYEFHLRAGVDSRGNPVYLRKWFHACGEFVSGQSIPSSLIEQSGSWTQAQRDAQVAAMNSIGGIGSGATQGVLSAKSGRLPTAGSTWQAHAFLEHHQLGDQWRAQ
jgi:hypothetical protein